jgi:acyl-coenzyme A thioesterase PaaI-like protein
MSDAEPLNGKIFGVGQPCFGCAVDHPIGFRLEFEREELEGGGEGIVTRFTPGERYQGPPGIMHGGLVSTLADEIAAWAIVAGKGKFGFTVSMSAKFHGPVRIGKEVIGRGRITKDLRRLLDIEVTLEQEGQKAFTGEFRFALLDKSGAERLLGGPLPEAWERFSR